MKDAVSRFVGQKVIIHLAANWAVIGTVAGVAGDTAEVRDEAGVSTFVNLDRIITIEPYRVQAGTGHYI
ncbi:MAG: hypothetical protein HYY54_05470 [candidate division NC10 bacterium]|nr:hypothetical protein [candidate division NC10 bacterium]MBI3003057.1 hypothetical protein [candidate division NC10 bacterium]